MPDVAPPFYHVCQRLLKKLDDTVLKDQLQAIQVEADQSLLDINLLSKVHQGGFRWYWSSRDSTEEQYGWGVADTISARSPEGALDTVQSRFSDFLKDSRYVGGFRFDWRANISEEWEDYGVARFWLPRFSLLRKGNEVIFRCHLRGNEEGRVKRVLRSYPMPARNGARSGLEIIGRQDSPTEQSWIGLVEDVLQHIQDGAFRKAVLARHTTFTFDTRLRRLPFFAELRQDTPGCFHHFLSPGHTSSFIGASPERLLRMDGRQLISEAVAGTRPRGSSDSWDAVLEDELLSSEKDRLEHVHVQNFIQETFDELCEDVHADKQPQSLALKRGRHLHAKVRGTLHHKISLTDVVQKLHPTPAVAGLPVQPSLDYLRTDEPFDRGWYAGGIGWIGSASAEFAVGIRSALLRENKLNLYAGAGIVPGSYPPQEWKEVEHKISDYVAQFRETPAL